MGIVVVLKGPAWVIALVVALILLAGFAEGTYRLWRDSESKLRRQQSDELAEVRLYGDCTVTGVDIQMFVRECAQAVPALSPAKQMELVEGTLPRDEELDHRVAVMQHEHATLSQYEERYATDVFRVVEDLRRRGYVPEADMEWLNHPRDLDGIERVGDRLSDIGRRVRPKHLRQAT